MGKHIAKHCAQTVWTTLWIDDHYSVNRTWNLRNMIKDCWYVNALVITTYNGVKGNVMILDKVWQNQCLWLKRKQRGYDFGLPRPPFFHLSLTLLSNCWVIKLLPLMKAVHRYLLEFTYTVVVLAIISMQAWTVYSLIWSSI